MQGGWSLVMVCRVGTQGVLRLSWGLASMAGASLTDTVLQTRR